MMRAARARWNYANYAGWRSQPALKIRERIPFVVLGVKICLVFLTFPYPEPVPKKLCDFYWLQLRITCKSGWIAQAEKRYCVSKEGRLQRSSRRTTSKGCAPDLTAQDLPRATENIREFKIRRLRTTNYGGRALPYVCSTGLSRANIER